MDNLKILANLEKAREIIEAIPEQRINLNTFKRTSRCGTIMCLFGWLSVNPFFKEQGLELNQDHGIYSPTDESWNNVNDLFGPDAQHLFATRNSVMIDHVLCLIHGDMNDKELALRRIDHRLQGMEEIEKK